MKMMSVVFAASMLLTSCYSYTSVVGSGAQGSNETTSWNHYVIFGLAPVGVSSSKQMAGEAAAQIRSAAKERMFVLHNSPSNYRGKY